MRPRRFLLLLVALGAAACASSANAPRRNRNPNLITQEEIDNASAMNAYEVVQRLRPSFLYTRGAESLRNPAPPTPVVYVDEVRYGQLNDLRSISANVVSEIRYMSAIEATSRFGTGHTGGAILVKTRTR